MSDSPQPRPRPRYPTSSSTSRERPILIMHSEDSDVLPRVPSGTNVRSPGILSKIVRASRSRSARSISARSNSARSNSAVEPTSSNNAPADGNLSDVMCIRNETSEYENKKGKGSKSNWRRLRKTVAAATGFRGVFSKKHREAEPSKLRVLDKIETGKECISGDGSQKVETREEGSERKIEDEVLGNEDTCHYNKDQIEDGSQETSEAALPSPVAARGSIDEETEDKERQKQSKDGTIQNDKGPDFDSGIMDVHSFMSDLRNIPHTSLQTIQNPANFNNDHQRMQHQQESSSVGKEEDTVKLAQDSKENFSLCLESNAKDDFFESVPAHGTTIVTDENEVFDTRGEGKMDADNSAKEKDTSNKTPFSAQGVETKSIIIEASNKNMKNNITENVSGEDRCTAPSVQEGNNNAQDSSSMGRPTTSSSHGDLPNIQEDTPMTEASFGFVEHCEGDGEDWIRDLLDAALAPGANIMFQRSQSRIRGDVASSLNASLDGPNNNPSLSQARQSSQGSLSPHSLYSATSTTAKTTVIDAAGELRIEEQREKNESMEDRLRAKDHFVPPRRPSYHPKKQQDTSLVHQPSASFNQKTAILVSIHPESTATSRVVFCPRPSKRAEKKSTSMVTLWRSKRNLAVCAIFAILISAGMLSYLRFALCISFVSTSPAAQSSHIHYTLTQRLTYPIGTILYKKDPGTISCQKHEMASHSTGVCDGASCLQSSYDFWDQNTTPSTGFPAMVFQLLRNLFSKRKARQQHREISQNRRHIQRKESASSG